MVTCYDMFRSVNEIVFWFLAFECFGDLCVVRLKNGFIINNTK